MDVGDDCNGVSVGAHDRSLVAISSHVSRRRHSRVWRWARVITCERTRAPSKPSSTASAQARISSGERVPANSSASIVQQSPRRDSWAVGRCGSLRGARRSTRAFGPGCRRGSRGPQLIGLPAGSGMSHASTVVGTYGQASPQPIVIAQSACSCISSVSFFGLRPARSKPTSRIASTTGGHISAAGSVAGGLGAHVLGAVALEERLRHLRAPGVVVADEQHVANRLLVSLLLAGASSVVMQRIVLH